MTTSMAQIHYAVTTIYAGSAIVATLLLLLIARILRMK